jgi:hypothetical protein
MHINVSICYVWIDFNLVNGDADDNVRIKLYQQLSFAANPKTEKLSAQTTAQRHISYQGQQAFTGC